MGTIYCTSADIYNRFGQGNVTSWAELGDDDANTRITWAISEAGRIIDETMRGGIYAVPFEASPDTPEQIKSIAAFLAGYELRRIRAVESVPLEQDAFYENARKETIMTLRKMARGYVYIGGIKPVVQTTPKAVNGTNPIDSTTDDIPETSTT